MKLFTAIQHDAQLLENFLTHYSRAGVTQFLIAIDARFEGAVAEFFRNYNIQLFRDLDVRDTVIGGVTAITQIRERHQSADEWVIIVDLDEFVEFNPSIHEIITQAELEGANVVRSIMWDRFSEDGGLVRVTSGSDLSHLFPIRARFIQNIMGGADYKGVLVKGHLKSFAAHHLFRDEVVCSRVLELSHYKWTEGSISRLRAAHEMVAAAGRPFAAEYARVLDHFERHGRFAWEEFGGEIAPLPSQ
jgi:Glycosyl transferase family 2